MNSKIIHIRSQDCILPDESGFNSNITFTLNEAITCKQTETILVRPLSTTIPFSWYNVNYANSWIDWQETDASGNTSAHSYQVPVGNYNILQVSAAIQQGMTATSGRGFVYKFTYDKITNRMVFQITQGHGTCKMLFKTGAHSIYSCRFMLGFGAKDVSFTDTAPTVSTQTCDVSAYENIYIHSNLGITNQYISSSRNVSDVLVKIPVNGAPYSYLFWENIARTEYASSLKIISAINIYLTDSEGHSLNLNGNDWFMSIEFIIVPTLEAIELQRNNEMIPIDIIS
jgi:hypothetical protein